MKTTILVVEDDQFFARVIDRFLKRAGYDLIYCKDGEEGWNTFREKSFDLCLFDINMPKKDGFQLALDVRQIDQNVPIIFMSGRGSEADRIHGFEVGCDDYIVKPFNLEELLMRINVWLKRSKSLFSDQHIQYNLGELVFDFTQLYLSNFSSGMTIQITAKEGRLLALLCEHANIKISRQFVLDSLWENPDFFAGRSLDVYLTRLRKHLHTTSTVRIETFHKNGLRLVINNSSGIETSNRM